MDLQSNSQKGFPTIFEFSSAAGFGVVLALSQGLGGAGQKFVFHFTIRALIIFLGGFASFFSYLRLVLTRGSKTLQPIRYAGMVAFGLILLLACLCQLRVIPLPQLFQSFAGVLAALSFIGTGFAMVHYLVHCAEQEELRQEAQERDSPIKPSS